METGACSCSDDFDPPEFFALNFRRARKEHRCCECGEVIPIGTQYEYISGKWCGDFETFKTCPTCARIRVDFCSGLGNLRSHLREILGCELT